MLILAVVKADTRAKIVKWISTSVSHHLVQTLQHVRRVQIYTSARALLVIQAKIVILMLMSASLLPARTVEYVYKV